MPNVIIAGLVAIVALFGGAALLSNNKSGADATQKQTYQEVQSAVASAKKAFATWSKTPVMKRVQVLYKLRSLIEKNLDELTLLVAKENGKGFDVENVNNSGIGILNIKKRAKLIGAEIELKSKINEGTELIIIYKTKNHEKI